MKTVGRLLLTVVIVIAACAAGYELWDYYMWSPWTRDAHVQADVVTVAPDVAGFVTDLRVKDNQFVHKGDVLMIIDQARYTPRWPRPTPMSRPKRPTWTISSSSGNGARS